MNYRTMPYALLCSALLLSLPLAGQYTYTPTVSLADNTPFCATINCLTPLAGNNLEIKAAADGTVFGLTNGHAVNTYIARQPLPISGNSTQAITQAGAFCPTVSSITNMVPGSQLLWDTGALQEPVVVSSIPGGIDHKICIVNFSNLHASGVSYVNPGQGWAKAPLALQLAGGHYILHVSAGRVSASQVLALNSLSSPAANVFALNSTGTTWVALGTQWMSTVEIAADGTIWGIGASSKVYLWNGSGWTLEPGTLSNLAVASANRIWGVDSSGILYSWNGTALVALSPAPPFTPSHAKNALAVAGEGSLSVLDTSGGIHISTDNGQTWSTILGTAASITAGGASVFTRDSSGASYHVNLIAPTITSTGTGTYANFGLCLPPLNGCNGVVHTMTVTSSFGGLGGAHGTAGVSSQEIGGWNSQFNLAATETGAHCDLFFGASGDASCNDSAVGNAVCSGMGNLGEGGGPVPISSAGEALTGGVWLGPGQDGYTIEKDGYYCDVQTYCTAATSPPLCESPDPVYIVQPGGVTPDLACQAHDKWVELVPWLNYQYYGAHTLCLNFLGKAYPQGPEGVPVNCTQ